MMDSSKEKNYTEELLSHFSNAVKQVQMEQMSKEKTSNSGEMRFYIENDSPSGRILSSCLEMIFFHGLKRKECGIWEVVRYFCRNDIIHEIDHLRHVKTDKGRGRAWILCALNEKELEGYLQSFQMELSHMYKYYNRSCIICGSQASIMQTLISGLDFVDFKLKIDVPYLDFGITNATPRSDSSTLKLRTNSNADRGSVVHIDTKVISETGQKAVDYVKEIWSQGSTSQEKSINYTNTRTVVAVNAKQSTMQARKYCPDCNNRNELVCLCIKRNSESVNTSSASENVKLLESVLDSGNHQLPGCQTEIASSEASSTALPYLTQRVNPFNRTSEKSMTKLKFRRFNQEVLVVDSPIEVIRKPIKRRYKFSDCASDISSKSEDITSIIRRSSIISTEADSTKRYGSLSDLCLSDPLIGFDPRQDDPDEATSQQFKMQSITDSQSVRDEVEGATQSPFSVTHNSESLTPIPIDVSQITEGVNEKCNNELTQTNKHEYVVSSQGRIASNTLETSDTSVKETVVSHNKTTGDYNISMDGTPCSDDSRDSTSIGDKKDFESNTDSNLISDSTMGLKNDTRMEEQENINRDNGLQIQQKERPDSLNIDDLDRQNKEADSMLKLNKTGDTSETASYPTSENNNLDKLNKTEVESLSPEERQGIRKSKGMRRYRSESEHLLNTWTQQEVERLRAEIQTKLKPSRDRLEKVRKSIAEKSLYQEGGGSFRHDSSFMLDKDSETSSNSRPLFDDSSDDVTDHDGSSSVSQDADSHFERDVTPRGQGSSNSFTSSSSLPAAFSGVMISDGTEISSHKSVASIDNTLRLYLMLEILSDENEEVIKLFHVSTGHSEGNWSPLYLLFSDSFLYFLRSGDGNCPYQAEHVVSYEDLDYISVGYNNQTMQFVFYKKKSMPGKTTKKTRVRARTKVTIDTADKDLTDLVISTLTRAVVIFTRQSVIKVCPPIFHDAKEHQISLIKYLRSEGYTGDIQLYQLVHWEDPDFVTGANMSKISLEGTLKYKLHSFWGSSWKTAYFVLSGGILYQYAGKDREKPETSYDLTGNNCVGCKRIRSNGPANSSLEFEVDFKDESKLELCGFSDVEVTEWLQCLCMIVSLDQSSTIDKEVSTDGLVLKMLNHDALVPCSLIIADEALLLCHEDPHTGFCRTLARTSREDITAINIDRKKSFVCEVVVTMPSEQSQIAKWGIFFPCQGPLEAFLSVINSFSKAPTINDKGNESPLAHYSEARILLDNRWTRTDNLLKGRSGSAENYTFL